MENELRYLPEKTLGKAGRDYSSRDKELTVVMFPYDSHSAFPKAIQELHRVLTIPFNLIVVEGNAPDEVRSRLEDCESRYGNMTVLYSTQYLSPGGIINQARPQIKTKYSFFMDNEICVKPGGIERMLTNAKNWKTDIVFPKHSLISREFKRPRQETVSIETPGMRLAFLISTESLARLLKVDERTDLYTAGWDLMLEFRAKGLRTMISDEAWVESIPEHPVRGSDRSLYRYQWDLDRHLDLVVYFQNKWNLEIKDGLYQRWFESKSRKVSASRFPAFLNWEFMLNGSFAGKSSIKPQSLASMHALRPDVASDRAATAAVYESGERE